MKKPVMLVLAAALTLLACGKPAPLSEPKADPLKIESHLRFLADDLLEGRDTGSRGHEIASLYIAEQFRALGLKGAAADGGYYQQVPLRKALLVPGSAKLSFQFADKTEELSYPQQFFTGPSLQQTSVALSAPMVFVGYGLVSDAFALNDYAGLDVAGKVVVMLAGLPASLPSEERAYLGSMKTEFAAERGAVGILTVQTRSRNKPGLMPTVYYI